MLLIGAVQAQVVELDKFVVTASPLGELHRTVGKSSMGDDSTLIDTPRSVSSIDTEFMSQFNIDSIDKIAVYTSNVQSVGSFGQSATVNVRGDLAETYINNQRRTNNSFGFRPGFNAVESLDIVHGAPSVVFGPGFYSGGYVNLITKKSTNEKFTDISVQFQTLDEYGNRKVMVNNVVTIDTNIPLNDSSALRMSYETIVNKDFYEHDLFLTYNYTSNKSSLTVNLQVSRQDTPEKIGVNRVTQQLIDTGLYHSGTITNALDASEVPNGPLVHLDRLTTTMGEDDFGKADVLFGQVIYTNKLTDNLTFNNLTLAEYVDRQRFAAYEYLEYVTQRTFDNRSEFHYESENAYTIGGVALRYEYRNAQNNYFNTFFNAWDISAGAPSDASSFVEYYPGRPGTDGQLFFGPLDYLFDTSLSKLWTASGFFQQRYTLNRWQFVYGLRGDSYYAKATDPLTYSVSDTVRTSTGGYNASLIYNINNKWSVYATYNRASAVNASVTGGAIVLDTDFTINKKNFRSVNKLYEVGTRYQDNDTTISLTGFWQYRQQHNFYVNEPDDIMVRGIELEHRYLLTKNLFVFTNLTYMEANVDNSFPFEFNGIGLPAATGPGDYRIPGLSRIYANQTLSYHPKKNWTFGVTGLWQSEQSGNALGGYHIPSQHTINAHVSYQLQSWNLRVSGYNLTDQDNWIHNGDFYGANVVISRELPIRYEFALSKSF